MKNTILILGMLQGLAKANALDLPTCIDSATDQKVPILRTTAQDPAYSTLDPKTGHPEIFINPSMLPEFESSQDTLTFIIMHECGHVNLGHLQLGQVSTKRTNQEELAADCYAAKAVKRMGYTESDLERVLTDVDKLPKDPDHPAGTVRAQNIQKCFNQ